MLNCKEISERASDYIDKNMSFAQRMQLKFHLLMCKHCYHFVQQLAQTMRITSALKPNQPSDEDIDSLVRKMMDARNFNKD